MKSFFSISRSSRAICAAIIAAAAQSFATLPAYWSQTDIDGVGLAGSASETSGTFTVTAAGTDIWGTSDAFHFVYQRLNGNTQVIARVTGVQNTNVWAKAGVMIRENLTPTSRHAIALISAASGAAFQSRATTGGTSTGTTVAGIAAPRWVKLTRSGNQFSAYQSADGTTWTQIGTTRTIEMDPVVYVGLAVSSHTTSALCTATFTNVQLKAPPALFVVGSTMLGAGDAIAKKRLETLGYAVTVKAAASSVTSDANGKDLVVVSSSVASADVAGKFKTVAVPVVTWENAILDDMGMTGSVGGTDYGTTLSQTTATIFNAACNRATMYTSATGYGDGCQDMAAGITGTVPVLTAPGTVSWGKPNANAIKIAYQTGTTAHVTVFGYDKGAVMPGLTAPARRVFLFLTDNSEVTWTARGQSLFDNAIYWATNTKYYLTKKVLMLNYDPTLISKGNVRMDQYGAATPGWGWHDPISLEKNYLADITEGSGGYVRWKIAHYAEIPDYINQWVPITGPEQFNSATFTEQNYIDAYNIGVNTADWGAAGMAMPNGGNYGADYNKILDDYGVNAKVTNGEVDEVVVYSFPFAGFNESAMAGATAYDVNGPVIYRAGVPNFIVMGLNYERQINEALESFGHRVESLVGKQTFGVDPTVPYYPCYWPDFPVSFCGDTRPATPVRNLWDKFTIVEGNLSGEAGVGAAHWAPNAINRGSEYNWSLTTSQYSMADDWEFNYPLLIGSATKRLVNVDEWRPMIVPVPEDATDGRGFKKWWYQHMPRVPGHYKDAANSVNDGKLNNWWEYIVNFNKHPETQFH